MRARAMYTALQAMRGIDLVAAVTVLAEIGDLSRFQNPRELMGYLGLVPSESSTGDMIKQATLAKVIEADILAAKPEREATPTCFACDRENRGRFCSARCRDAHDAGFPSFERQRELARGFPDPSKPLALVAGGPVPDCMRCGDPCIETARGKHGEPFCGWRCRDDKPKDCAICGTGLNASGRRGPYCSPGCANTPRKAKKGTDSQNAI